MRFRLFTAMADQTSAIKQLADLWREAASQIDDDFARLECLALIDDWYNLRTACAALASSADVTSYSIAGRTVTRAAMASVKHEVESLADEILAMLRRGGGALVADIRRAFIP